MVNIHLSRALDVTDFASCASRLLFFCCLKQKNKRVGVTLR